MHFDLIVLSSIQIREYNAQIKFRYVVYLDEAVVEMEADEACADATVRGDELLDDAPYGGLDVDGAIGVARVETFLQSGTGIREDCRQKRMERYQEQQHHVGAT